MKDLLSLEGLTETMLDDLLGRSVELARAFRSGRVNRSLEGKRIALVNDDQGWRNTTALDVGARMLGAQCTPVPISLDGREAISDLAGYLDNWFHLIAIRSPNLKKMTELARTAAVPVLNLRTRENHPCETLGDLSYVEESGRNFRGLSVVAVSAASNIMHSWAEVASATSLRLTQIAPRPYWMDEGRWASPNILRTDDFERIAEADVVITDCWPDGDASSEFEAMRITGAVLDGLKPDCLFVPCPPVTRGQEVSDDGMTHPKCVATEAKAHLLHAQNACLETMLRTPK